MAPATAQAREEPVTVTELNQQTVRTLDAIHLATATTIGSELDAVLTYDKRVADSAAAMGLTVAAPT